MSVSVRAIALVLLFSSFIAPPASAGGRDVARAEDMIQDQLFDEAIVDIQQSLRKKQDYTSMKELRGLLDQARFGLAVQESSIASYELYLEGRSDGNNANLARLRICEFSFATASASADDTRSAEPMLSFLDQHGTCMEANDARSIAVDLTIESARAQGSSQAFNDALALFPAECEAAGLVVEEDNAAHAEALTSGRLEAYLAYLDTHPDGQHLGDVRGRAEELAWEAVLSERSEASVDGFLARFPAGAHADEATVLRKDRTRGLRRVSGDTWVAFGDEPWPGASTIVYVPEPGTLTGRPRVQIQAYHTVPSGGEVISPLTHPAAPWIEARLGLDSGVLEAPWVEGSGPGDHGEWSFEVPFVLRTWSYAGSKVERYVLQILDGPGGDVLEARDLLPSTELEVAQGLSSRSSAQLLELGRSIRGDAPFDDLLHAAIGVATADYGAAARHWVAAREDWSALPLDAPGARSNEHGGLVLVAYGDPARAPGSDSNAFLPLAMSASGKAGPVRVVDPGLSGGVYRGDGRQVGSFTTSGAQGSHCGRAGSRGSLSVGSGVDPQSLFRRYLYLVHPTSKVSALSVSIAKFQERWPALAETMGDTPEDWLHLQLQGAGTQALELGRAAGHLSDLDGDGLPDVLRSRGGTLVLVSFDTTGKLQTRSLGLTGDVELILDLDGDGTQEIVTRFSQGDGTVFQVGRSAGAQQGRLVSVNSPCGASQ